MATVIAALAAGIVFGLLPGTGRLKRLMKMLGMMGLFTLLMTMGIEIGGDEQVMSSIGRLGLTALLLALFAVVGSVLCVLPIAPLLRHTRLDEVAED